VGVFCSTIIASVGRASLERAVGSVLEQGMDAAEREVVVVNDSGGPLAPADWQRAPNVRVLETPQRERCVARNTGAAVARGAYLHFLDDDDWLLPGGLASLRDVARLTRAAWIYGAARLVDRDDRLLVEHHVGVEGNGFVQVMAGEWLPLQASLVRAGCFFAAGGFDVRLRVCQDKDLCRRVALSQDFATTRAAVVCIRRDRERSTTAYRLANSYSVWSRDNVLDEPGVFARLRGSARTAYWRGRWVRAYLTGVAWNVGRRRPGRAMWRAMGAVAAFGCSIGGWCRGEFWRALACSHSRRHVR
jgi:glycosyltransferase involved in cell wall biosynthesis